MAKSRAWKKSVCAALVLGAMAATAADAAVVVSLSPTPTVPSVGGTLTLDVVITGVADLFAYNYSLSYNAAAVQLTGESQGSFLGASSTYFAGSVDNTAGSYTFTGAALDGATAGKSGTGVLEHLTFTVVSALPSTFSFVPADTGFYDSSFSTISVTANSLTVAAVPEPATYAMFGAGIAGLLAWRRRSARASAA